VRLLDVNGDGLLDVATGWEQGRVVRLYINPGPSRVRANWPRVTVGSVEDAEDAVPVDLDGDGAVDVVSATEGKTRSLFVHWAPRDRSQLMDPDRWTTAQFSAAHGRRWMYILPMQVDGKGGVDLVVGSKNEGGLVGWLEAPENPRDVDGWKLHKLMDATWVMSLISSDMDGDGDLDLLLSNRKESSSGVFWLENPGAAAASADAPWTKHTIGATGREVMFIDQADLDGDGRAEVIASMKPVEIQVFRQTGSPSAPWKTEAFELDAKTVGSAKSVNAVDVDLDGRMDLVFTFELAHPPRSGVVWAPLLPGSPAAIHSLREISGPEGVIFDRGRLVDLDGDGDLDVVVTEEGATTTPRPDDRNVHQLGVIWYENPTR
jgi:hypothetical protein